MPRRIQQLAGTLVGLLLAAVAVVWMSGRADDPRKPPAPVAAVSEFDGPLALVWLQYASDADPIVGTAQADFLAALPPQTRIAVTVGDAPESALFQRFLDKQALAESLRGRLQIVAVPGPVSPWTRDRALFLRNADRGLRFLVSPPPDAAWVRRSNDAKAVPLLAAALMPAKVLEIPLEFDGGDLALTSDAVLFGANLWARNQGRGYASVRDLAVALQQWTGRPALGLGENDGDVPPYHLAMYLAVTGMKQALVGDPGLARAVTGPRWNTGEKSVEGDTALLANDSTETQAQFDRAALDLQRAGWQVQRIPVVAVDDRTYLTWTNVVAESGPAGKRVYLPVYAREGDRADAPVRKLDAAATAIWQQQGFVVAPIRVAGVWPHHGTIGCLVGVLGRGPADN